MCIPLLVPTIPNALDRLCLVSRTNRCAVVSALRATALLALANLVPAAVAQKYEPPPPPLDSAPCVPTKKDPCAPQPQSPDIPSTADRFPFPGETPAPAKPSPDQPAPAEKFPFPGEPSPAASSSSSSSSSTASADDAAEDVPDPAPLNPKDKPTRSQRRHLPKVEDLNQREAEDLTISRYYVSTGNYLAAYLRAKDAVKVIPDDAEAHFALAATAERLHKTDEAVAEYNLFLKMDPENNKAKNARKALDSLKPK